jgi:heavy metal translocating P-type ATPase
MTILKEIYNCKNLDEARLYQNVEHNWIDHLVSRVTIKSLNKGRVRFLLNFQGDEILNDFLRREVHKISGSVFKGYSTRTKTCLISFDPTETSTEKVSIGVLKAVKEFARIHGECDVGESHPAAHHYGHSHDHDKCGHDHSHLATEAAIKKEIFKLGLTGSALVYFLVKRVRLGAGLPVPPAITLAASILTVLKGYPIFKDGARTLKPGKKLTDDSLISIAVLATLVMKESLTGLSVVWLINLGRLFETMTINRSRAAIKDLLDLAPDDAWLIPDDLKSAGLPEKVLVEKISKGQVIRVFASERVPLDGKIVKGTAAIQESYLTGEPIAKEKSVSDFVYAGSMVESGEIDIEVENLATETVMAKMIHSVESLRENKAPIEKFGTKFASKFVPISLGTSGLVYLFTRDWQRAVTALVIACPCAAGLATPTAVSASIGKAAKKGILIKGGVHLETAAKIDTAVFDKTGTLTTGYPTVVEQIFKGEKDKGTEILQLAASAEQHTTHPLGRVIVNLAKDNKIDLIKAEDYELYPGLGIEANINGKSVICGNLKLIEQKNIKISAFFQKEIEKSNQSVQSAVFVAISGSLTAIYLLEDEIKPEAKEVLQKLRDMGINNIHLVSGDRLPVVEAVAKELGITHFEAEVLPGNKHEYVKRLQQQGFKVAMVGDGVNDAQALVGADLSLAMASSRCDLAIEAADITLARDDLFLIPESIEISKKTLKTIKTNFIASIGINGVGLVMGAGGKLNLFTAAIVHNLSTIAVVLNSFRLGQNINKKQ